MAGKILVIIFSFFEEVLRGDSFYLVLLAFWLCLKWCEIANFCRCTDLFNELWNRLGDSIRHVKLVAVSYCLGLMSYNLFLVMYSKMPKGKMHIPFLWNKNFNNGCPRVPTLQQLNHKNVLLDNSLIHSYNMDIIHIDTTALQSMVIQLRFKLQLRIICFIWSKILTKY